MANHYINFLADQLAKAQIKFTLEDFGFSLEAKGNILRENHMLLDEVLKNGHALNFYRKRLECVVPQ